MSTDAYDEVVSKVRNLPPTSNNCSSTKLRTFSGRMDKAGGAFWSCRVWARRSGPELTLRTTCGRSGRHGMDSIFARRLRLSLHSVPKGYQLQEEPLLKFTPRTK